MTTLDPGAIDVLTHGATDRPFSTAFFASIAAAIITEGFEVLVHEVIDAMTTAPSLRPNVWPSRETSTSRRSPSTP